MSNSFIDPEIGNRIRNFREKSGLTRTELSKRSGVPMSTLSSIEKEGSRPVLKDIFKIADVLEISPYDLIYNNSTPTQKGKKDLNGEEMEL